MLIFIYGIFGMIPMVDKGVLFSRGCCSIIIRRIMHKSTQHSTYRRSTSRSSQTQSLSKTPFRTIVKRRNDSIPSAQLYEQPPLSKLTKTMSQSQLVESNSQLARSQLLEQTTKTQMSSPKPVHLTTDIREYVKKMGGKKEETLLHRKASSLLREESVLRQSSRSILNSTNAPTKPRSIEEL